MEEIYLSSDALRSLSKLTRYLILNHNIVLKMSDPVVLIKVFETCQQIDDPHVDNLFEQLHQDMNTVNENGHTNFVFYADDNVLQMIEPSFDLLVYRDSAGNERVQHQML